jgi:tRNA-dihydrouridine synthase
VAQIFSSKPEMIEYAARLVYELGFDGVDLNMGCPDRSIEKQGAGAALIKNPVNASLLVRASQQGVKGNIPVSVKTRIGYNKNELHTWLPVLLQEAPDAVTIHARTRKEMSKVPARWEHVAEAVAIRDKLRPGTRILGNGDVQTVQEATERVQDSGADGVMIGRGIYGNPWLFSQKTPTLEERLYTLAEHCILFEKYCAHKNFAVMKKHFKAYIHGFKGAVELRNTLMSATNAHEVESSITDWLKTV